MDVLGPALVAAELAGRYDVMETPRAAAAVQASEEHARLPFNEQIEFFRNKLNLGTQAWTDIWHDQHDRAFVVAGAAHADLVEDLRAAVDSAIADGTTLATFRKEFDQIVARHGWSYKGGRNWRTQVIYSTNVRTSYAAGRYRQMKEISSRRPYWRYRHSHASEDPREQHLAWDGMILMHDDPWWDTHYPPGGWGCKCYVEALSQRDLERLGKSGPDQAPALNMRTVTVGVNGPSPRVVEVPEGIDPGWAYAPGQSTWRDAPVIQERFAHDPVSYIAEGRRIREEILVAADVETVEGFEASFRTELRRRLREERGAGQVAAEIEELQVRGAPTTARRVRSAAAELPESWVRAGNSVKLMSRGTSRRGWYSEGTSGWPAMITTNKDPGNALHEYTHHLQRAMPGLDALFHRLHRRRTAGETRVTVTPGRNEPGRKDKYLKWYMGREYGADEVPREVWTMTIQMAFHPVWGEDYLLKMAADDDTELLDLLLGVLFRYDP